MNIWKTFVSFAKRRKEDKFWRNPDTYLAAIKLNDAGEQVYGRVKNKLALLEQIPDPETGYHYKDVVEVVGPTGKQLYRDDEIDEYRAVELITPSHISTFAFEAIIPDPRDYFRLIDCFKENGQKVEFPWASLENNSDWRSGLCTAENLNHAERILKGFVSKKEGRQVKNIRPCDVRIAQR
ncbi:MAG: hypothetical protein U0Y08_05975 [Bacteroidia bacterium]